jgi:hypothetical protein
VPDSEQSGVFEVLHRIRSGRLKVFRTLENFFRECRLYRRDGQGRIVRQNDLSMNRHFLRFVDSLLMFGARRADQTGGRKHMPEPILVEFFAWLVSFFA